MCVCVFVVTEYIYQVVTNNSAGSTSSGWTVARTLAGGTVHLYTTFNVT